MKSAGNFKQLWVACIATAVFVFTAAGQALGQATVTTDQQDYPPGSTVQISGSGFQAGETVQLQVLNLTDTSDAGPEHDPWTVTADATGNFAATWYVTEDEAGATLQLTATGLSSGLTAQHTFFDARVAGSVTVVYQSGTATYGTSSSITYTVIVGSTGSGSGAATLSVTGLPPGATNVFSTGGTNGLVTFSNGNPTDTNTLTITTLSNTPAGTTTFTVTASNGGNPSDTNSVIVSKRSVTITNVVASGKIYDGTTNATLSGGVVSNTANGDAVTFTAGSGTFASQYVGSRAVTAIGYALTTSGVSTNYSLSAQPLVANATISARSTTITNVTAANKTYDGATTATLSGGAVSNTVSGDSVTFTAGSGTFASQFVGSRAVTAIGYALTASGISTNYSLSAQPLVPSATISARSTTITNVTAANKAYDGTTNAALSGGAVSNTVSGDTVTFTAGSGTFASQYVGSRAVTATGYALTASGVSTNYSLSAQPLVPSATILGRSVTITNVTAANKTYDGTNTATLSGGAVSNTVSGDTVTFSAGTGTFASKNAGSQAVTAVGYALTASGISTNYNLSAQPLVPNATISALAVSLTGSRVYDGTTNAVAAILTVANVVSGDTVNVASGTGGLASSDVGSRSITSFGTLALGNNPAGDYTLTGATGSVTITQASTTNVVSVSANPSPTGSNVTLTATLSAVAPGSGTPTSVVQFLADGSPIGAPATLSGGVANLTTNSLTHGYHTIAAQYAGDGNFFGSTNTYPNLLINSAPVAQTATWPRPFNFTLKIRIATLATNWSDADSDTITLTSVAATSTNGISVSKDSTYIYYNSTNGSNPDQFSYVISDGFVSTTGMVNIVVTSIPATASTSTNQITFNGGVPTLHLAGIPGRTYYVQASTNMTDWVAISTNVAGTNGLWQVIDTDATNYPLRVYRTSDQP